MWPTGGRDVGAYHRSVAADSVAMAFVAGDAFAGCRRRQGELDRRDCSNEGDGASDELATRHARIRHV